MKEFRTVCIFHKKENLYDAYYFQGFFKWIGLYYYLQKCEGESNYVVENIENNQFDMFLFIKDEKEKWFEELSKKVRTKKIYYINTKKMKNKEALLDLCSHLEKEFSRERPNSTLCFLKDMVRIYDKYNIASLLYDYTSILVNTMSVKVVKYMKSQYEKILSELVDLEDLFLPKKEIGKEYYLYAKLYCQYQIDRLAVRIREIKPYSIGEQIDLVHRIYEYDLNFYHAEFLKSLYANLDEMYYMYSTDHLRVCIKYCNIKICKSSLFANLGKSQKSIHKYRVRNDALECSYKCNPNNYLAKFGLAEIYTELEQFSLAQDFYENIIDQLIDHQNIGAMDFINFDYMPLLELECLFKCYLRMGKINYAKDFFYSNALKIQDYINSIEERDNFFNLVYYNWDGKMIDLISDAIKEGFKRKRLSILKANIKDEHVTKYFQN